MFSFKWPLFLMLLPLPWVLLKIIKYNKTVQTVVSVNIPISHRLQASFSKVIASSVTNIKIINILLYCIWCLLILSLMRPQIVNTLDTIGKNGFDIMLGIDLSASMQGLDFSTQQHEITRLDATKAVVKSFVEKRMDDRIGLIVFAEHAYYYVPLSHDKTAVVKMLNNLAVGMAGDSTAIGDAIGLAVKKLAAKKEGSKLFILLTDGEDNASSIPPLEATKIAKQYGVKIYTIGIGSDGLVAYRDAYGRLQQAFLRLDEKLLTQVASITGGDYQRANNFDVLSKIYDKIDTAERVLNKTELVVISQELYKYPLIISLALFFAIFFRQTKLWN